MKIIVKHVLFSISLLVLSPCSFAQTLRGVVRDAAGGNVLEGAQVNLSAVSDTVRRSTATDASGQYIFQNLRPGYYALEISHDGFRPMVLREISVAGGKETLLDIAYDRNVGLPMLTVVNTGSRRPPQPLSEIPLTREQTLRFPATFFDPARLALTYPGVMNNDDQANGLAIRGNSPASLRWRLEGVDIVNPNHLTNAGTFSDRPAAAAGGVLMFSAQLLDNSSLLTGSFPAAYGDALGGIMDMNLRNGNNRRHEFTAQAGLIGLDLAAEGPLTKEGKNSYLVNYRYSTVGLLGQMGISFGDETINFQDLSFKLHFSGKNGAQWSLFGLGGLSKNIFEHKTDSAAIEQFKDFFDIDYKSKTGIIGLANRTPLGRRGSLKFAVAASGQTNTRTSFSNIYEQSNSDDDLSESKISGSAEGTYRLGAQWRLLGGAAFTRQYFRGASGTGAAQPQVVEHRFLTTQPWIDLHWQSRSEKTEVRVGVHGLLFPYKEKNAVEPRIVVTQTIAARQRLAFSCGMYSQVAPLWLPEENLGLQRAVHAGLRHTWNAAENWAISTELFYQNISEAGESGGIATSFSVLNENEYRSFAPMAVFYDGEGLNTGVEINAEHYLANGWFMVTNLTLFKSECRGSDQTWRPSRWDARHIANLTAGKEWQRDKRPGQVRAFGLNGRLGWSGGLRAMPVDAAASAADGMTVFDDSNGFTVRQKDYFRLDLRVYWKRSLSDRRNSTFAMDFQNATMQENTAYQYYDPFTKQVETKYQLGLIPNISWRLEF